MCDKSQLRFANAYALASRDLRLQIDEAFRLFAEGTEALGVVSLSGQTLTGSESSVNLALSPTAFSIEKFSTALATFQSIELCVLLVRAENVYPPVEAIKLLAAEHPRCNVIRVSSANSSFEFRQFDRLIEFAEAQIHKCGCCAHKEACGAAAIHFVPILEVRDSVQSPFC